MAAFEHKGIAINFLDDTGEFSASINGESIVAPSLAAIKKRIDKSKAFAEFSVLTRVGFYEYGKFRRVKVVGISKGRSKYGADSEPSYKLEDGRSVHPNQLHADTPENEAKLAAYGELLVSHVKENEEVRTRHAAEEKAAKAALSPLPKIPEKS